MRNTTIDTTPQAQVDGNGRQPRRRFPPIEIYPAGDQITLMQSVRAGRPQSIGLSFNMLPSFIGALVCFMRDTNAPPNIYARTIAEIEAAIPLEAVEAIRAARKPVITPH
jgi:hypothetical protein